MQVAKRKHIQEVITKAGKILGRHRSRKGAIAQIRAIKAQERKI
jgi:hypothetical protein